MASKPFTVTPEQRILLEDLAEELVKPLAGMFFEVEGVPMSTVKMADGQFKKKTLIAGWNFSIEYCYVGARGKHIFGLSPEDAQEYTHAEMDAKQLDEVFPLVGPKLAEAFGVVGFEKLPSVIDKIIYDRAIAAQKEKELAGQSYNNNPNFARF